MPKNFGEIEYLREKASLMRRLSSEHAAADNAMIAAKLAEVAAELERRVDVLQRLPAC